MPNPPNYLVPVSTRDTIRINEELSQSPLPCAILSMRILQVVHLFPPEQSAGTERYTEALSRVLLARGHDCSVLAGTYKTASEPALLISEQDGLSVFRLAGLRKRSGLRADIFDAAAGRFIRQFFSLWRPDLVHLHHWHQLTGHLVAICTEYGIPAVVTLHDQWTACPRIHRIQPNGTFCSAREAPCISCVDRDPWQTDQEIARELDLRYRLITEELKRATCILVPSVAQQQFLQQISDVPLERLRVVPLGSVVREHTEGQERHERISASPLKIGFWGYLTPFKGVHILLEAAHCLAEEFDGRVEWHLLGSPADSAYHEKLQRLAEGLPVTFHGPYHHSDIAILNLDIAVFPSLCYETYSFVLDEAFQLGIPVVVPDRGAPADRIGEAGTTFASGDPHDLARTLHPLVQQPERLARMRRATPKEGAVNMEAHATDMEKIYQDAASSRPKQCEPSGVYHSLLQHREQQLHDRERRLAECDVQAQELSRQIAHLTEELTHLQARLQEQVEEILRLQNTVAEREQAIADLRHQATAQDGLLRDLREQVAERDRLLAAARQSILGSLDAALKRLLGHSSADPSQISNNPRDVIRKDPE